MLYYWQAWLVWACSMYCFGGILMVVLLVQHDYTLILYIGVCYAVFRSHSGSRAVLIICLPSFCSRPSRPV